LRRAEYRFRENLLFASITLFTAFGLCPISSGVWTAVGTVVGTDAGVTGLTGFDPRHPEKRTAIMHTTQELTKTTPYFILSSRNPVFNSVYTRM
jgi:hypothetical protein